MYENNRLIFIHPHFREFGGQGESIYDYVNKDVSYCDKVLNYLKVFHPTLFSGPIYEHPFIPGKRMAGKTYTSDGYYVWDMDTYEYVTRYNLALPQDFVDHIMSEEGTKFLDSCIKVKNFEAAHILWKKDRVQPYLMENFLE